MAIQDWELQQYEMAASAVVSRLGWNPTEQVQCDDGSMCAWIRYGGDGPEDPCECLCHGWPEDEDDYLG